MIVLMVPTLTITPINFYIKRFFILRKGMTLRWTWKNYDLPMLRELSAWRHMLSFRQTLTWRGMLL